MTAHALDPEVIGWVAATMMLATFACQTVLGMRLFGVAANVAFITYGWAADLLPVMLLHTVVLPINLLHVARLLKRQQESSAGRPQ